KDVGFLSIWPFPELKDKFGAFCPLRGNIWDVYIGL
ncbi:uncharacterized protein METZ01_LOCUS436367, partial [marine metagenome]